MLSAASCIRCHNKICFSNAATGQTPQHKSKKRFCDHELPGHLQACIRQRPHAVGHSIRQTITLSGMLDSESKPRNLTFAVSQMASS